MHYAIHGGTFPACESIFFLLFLVYSLFSFLFLSPEIEIRLVGMRVAHR
jgi:hypothetical protein